MKLTDLYKPITRSIVSFAQNLSSNKDVKEVFGQLVEKPIEAFKSIGATPATVDLFLRAYGDVIKDNTVIVVKGQLISECIFDFLKFSKEPTKNLTYFCPRI